MSISHGIHEWMSHGTYEWATSHVNESWHIWMSLVTHRWENTTLMEVKCWTRRSHVTCQLVMVYMNEWVTAHMNESRHVCLSHVTCGRVMSQVTRLMHTCCDSFICAVTHSHVLWLVNVWHDSFVCAVTHSFIGHNERPWWVIQYRQSSIFSPMCDMTHSYVPWLFHMWLIMAVRRVMLHVPHVQHFFHVQHFWVMSRWPSQVAREWVTAHMNETRHVCMSHVTCGQVMSHVNESCHTHPRVMSRMSPNSVIHLDESYYTYCRVTSHVPWLFLNLNPKSLTLNPMMRWTCENACNILESCHVWSSHVAREWFTSHIGLKDLL